MRYLDPYRPKERFPPDRDPAMDVVYVIGPLRVPTAQTWKIENGSISIIEFTQNWTQTKQRKS